MSAQDPGISPFSPFKARTYRRLWGVWLIANLCMWMNDVTAAWIMTSIASSPVWVALVQTAATLPIFFLALPSGALADGLDRRKYLIAIQAWVAAVACVLAFLKFMDFLTPPALLALLFANGIGLAMRWPLFSAILPGLVGKEQLPAALGLNSVAMNVSRIVGPLIAGVIIGFAGSTWVFVVNAMLSVAAALIVAKWEHEHKPHPLGRESVIHSTRVGVQYVLQSSPLKNALLRVWIYFFGSSGLVAMLPLVARGIRSDGAEVFSMLLAAMGIGAIVSMTVLPRLIKRYSRDALILRAALLQAGAMLTVAQTDSLWLVLPAMVVHGMTSIAIANTLTVSFQISLPDWVRARGMSAYFMTMMGAVACGAAFWGKMASWSTVSMSVTVAATLGLAILAAVMRIRPDSGPIGDLSPRKIFEPPKHPEPPARGHILISIEYLVDPASADEFRKLMIDEGRASRLRQGAISWKLLRDLNNSGRFLEITTERSWIDHLRRFDRITGVDADLHDRKMRYHIGSEPPRIARYLEETTV
jgi:predicted MFS family arabinose efflux permease